jgi:hypothetical protein
MVLFSGIICESMHVVVCHCGKLCVTQPNPEEELLGALLEILDVVLLNQRQKMAKRRNASEKGLTAGRVSEQWLTYTSNPFVKPCIISVLYPRIDWESITSML